MKKKNVLNLIRYHSEGNDIGFRTEAYEIAKDFDASGDYQLSEYIMALLSNANTFVPQIEEKDCCFLEKRSTNNNDPLPLPESIQTDIIGIVNAVTHNAGINKFLFEGKPGTGKTETARQLARILERDLYYVDFTNLIDSKLGQTQKNIVTLFKEINTFSRPDKIIVLFDEIDALALDRINSNDLREMGRATSSLLKSFDALNEELVLIATTNLYKAFDKALTRRFDAVINFNRYSQEDIFEIADKIVEEQINKHGTISKNTRLLHKILSLSKNIVMPGDLKNIIKTSIAFSNPGSQSDYLKRIYRAIRKDVEDEIKFLSDNKFTCREIEVLTEISKSEISRKLNRK